MNVRVFALGSLMPSTVKDFSAQWDEYAALEGFYASPDILRDLLGPLLELERLAGKKICEVGCGNGRYLRTLASFAGHATAIEPSSGIERAKVVTREMNNITFIKEDFYNVGAIENVDYVFCLGVLHHMARPADALAKMRAMLARGGKAVVWVYGKEGNGLYLSLAKAVRVLTTRLPHAVLKFISKLLVWPLLGYIGLCRMLPLPMRRYMRNILSKLDRRTLELVIYDQLNPVIARYYSRDEIEALFRAAGYSDLNFFHRHGYSWTVLAS